MSDAPRVPDGGSQGSNKDEMGHRLQIPRLAPGPGDGRPARLPWWQAVRAVAAGTTATGLEADSRGAARAGRGAGEHRAVRAVQDAAVGAEGYATNATRVTSGGVIVTSRSVSPGPGSRGADGPVRVPQIRAKTATRRDAGKLTRSRMAYPGALNYCCGVSPGETRTRRRGPALITYSNQMDTEGNIFKFVMT